MTADDVRSVTTELERAYPGCNVVPAEDKGEVVAEISKGRAVAVIERSAPHFHLMARETYHVLRGTLFVSCEAMGHVLREGDILEIEPGQVHFARADGQLAWVEVRSIPGWSADDHFVL